MIFYLSDSTIFRKKINVQLIKKTNIRAVLKGLDIRNTRKLKMTIIDYLLSIITNLMPRIDNILKVDIGNTYRQYSKLDIDITN